MTFLRSVSSNSLGSTQRPARHRPARHPKADHARHPLVYPGDAVVMATVVATFALILSSTRPAVWIALEDTYAFVLRQLSAVVDFVKYVDSLY